MKLLNIQKKTGDPDLLDGRLTVYATVDLDVGDIMATRHPIASMVHNGFLVVQGNYRDQNNLQDFLKTEMGLSLEEGLSEFLEKLDGLESALDPEKLKEKMQDIGEIQDFIPTPAKVVPFNSEEEVLLQEGDVYYVGFFRNVANANLSVNSFPIIYQARYREQQLDRVRKEIEQLVSQVESDDMPEVHYSTLGADVGEKILKEYIPYMLYCRKDEKAFDAAKKKFRSFLRGYRFEEDIDQIMDLISLSEELGAWHYKMLELYARKITEMCRENFAEVEHIKSEIINLESEPKDG